MVTTLTDRLRTELQPDLHPIDPRGWAQTHFAGAKMNDRRRTRRVETIAEAMAARPGVPIPQLFNATYDVQAAYDLFDRPEATPDAIQAGHRRLVRQRLRTPGYYLLIEDTCFLSFSHRGLRVPGLGPIGGSEDGQQGFMLHSVFAVAVPRPDPAGAARDRPPVEVIGLADQQYLVRKDRPAGEPKHASTRRKLRDRESQRWLDSGDRVGPAPRGGDVRWVRVADREADIYEYLIKCKEDGHGYVVRVMQDRVVLDGAGGRAGLTRPWAESAGAMGGVTLDVRGRDGHEARRARLLVSFGAIRLQAPERPGRPAGSNPPIDGWFVRAWEPEPPEGVEPLEWLLYHDRPVADLSGALGVLRDYALRPLIEEFHKGLKTGMGAERLQLEAADRLFAATAVMSVVALRLLHLRELGRSEPEAPAERSGLDGWELRVLGTELRRSLVTVRDVLLAVGRLGGHMNRKSDGMPGWLTLWRGMNRLRDLTRGARLMREISSEDAHPDAPP
jgi:Transposase DNA-binding/Transposase Tn5 dimerisation domain